MERDHLAEINGDMVVLVAEFLDNTGDLEMDENSGVSSKHMKSLENFFESLKGMVKNWRCLDSIQLGMTLD